MLIPLPIRIRVHHSGYGRRVDLRRGVLADVGKHETTRKSRDFPDPALWHLQVHRFASGSTGIRALIAPQCGRRGAVLMRPIITICPDGSQRFCGMALRRFRSLVEEIDSGSARQFIECGSLIFAASDWRRHAPQIARHVIPTYIPEPTGNDMSDADAFEMPRLTFDLPRRDPIRLHEVPAASFAILDALASGQRAVFGTETFADDQEFLLAFALAVALVPAALWSDISVAAGFSKPLPDALVQWIGAKSISPPQPGSITAAMAGLPRDTSAEQATAEVFGGIAVDAMISGEIDETVITEDPFEDRARTRLTLGLGCPADFQPTMPSQGLAALVQLLDDIARSRPNPPATGISLQSAAAGVESCFGGNSQLGEMTPALTNFRWCHALARLCDGQPFPLGDPVGVSESLTELEIIFVGAHLVGDAVGWTSGLEALSKAAITALRSVCVEKPARDANVGMAFLLALARAGHALEIVGKMIAAGDGAVRAGIESALIATALLSGELDALRPRLVRELLGVAPAQPLEPPQCASAPRISLRSV